MEILIYIILLIIGLLIIYFYFFKKSPNDTENIEPDFDAYDDNTKNNWDDWFEDDYGYVEEVDDIKSNYLDLINGGFDDKFFNSLDLINNHLNSNDKFYLTDDIHITRDSGALYNFNIFYKNDLIGLVTRNGILLSRLSEYVDDGSNSYPKKTIDSQFDYKSIEYKLFSLIVSKHDELKQQHAIQHNLLNAAQKEIYNELLNRLL